MVLRMTSPWRHPDSGIYYFRQRVPTRIRHLVQREIEKISLRTRDPIVAKAEFARVSHQVQQRWKELSVGPRSLSERQAVAIAGEIYRAMVEQHGDNPSKVDGGNMAFVLDRLALRPKTMKMFIAGAKPELTKALLEKLHRDRLEYNARTIDDWLSVRGLLVDPCSRKMVGEAVDKAILAARELLDRMKMGDYSADPAADRFPKLELEPTNEKAPYKRPANLTFDNLIDAEAAKRAAGKHSRPLPKKSIAKYKRIAGEFAAFRKSDDATTTTVQEVEAWGDDMLEKALIDNRTVADKLTNIGTIINWGKASRVHRSAMASAETIAGKVERPKWIEKSADETSYTLEEARHLLRMTRTEIDPRSRWLPWLCLYAGLRISEANALRKEDFFKCEGRWFFKVTTKGGRTLKTSRSERQIPVHPALGNEGFMRWVEAADDGSLFASSATSFLGRWVRSDIVGITREEVSPNHGLRHLFVALCRRYGVQDEPREYLCGHASAKVHRKYGATDVMLPGLGVELDKIAPII